MARTKKLAVAVMAVALVLGSAKAASAQDLSLEVEAGAQVALSDSAQLSDQGPGFLMTLAGGLYATRHVRLAVEGRFDLADDARHHEVLGTATYFVDLRLFQLFAGLGVGRYWRDLDATGFSDEGFVIGVDAGARLALIGPLSASLLVSHTISESQHADPVWAHATQVGAAISLKL